MQNVSVVALFCDDVREEKSGQDTVIGVMPDSLTLHGIPAAREKGTPALPKLSLYVRIVFDAKATTPKSIDAKMATVDGKPIVEVEWDEAVVAKAFKDANDAGRPIVGLVAKIVGGPFVIPQSTSLLGIITIDGQEHIGGILNLILPTASEQPASQSPPAS